MNPWLVALDGLGTISAVLVPVFAWDYFRHCRRVPAPVVRPVAVFPPEPPASTSPAVPFDGAVIIDSGGAPRIPAARKDDWP